MNIWTAAKRKMLGSLRRSTMRARNAAFGFQDAPHGKPQMHGWFTDCKGERLVLPIAVTGFSITYPRVKEDPVDLTKPTEISLTCKLSGGSEIARILFKPDR